MTHNQLIPIRDGIKSFLNFFYFFSCGGIWGVAEKANGDEENQVEGRIVHFGENGVRFFDLLERIGELQ